METCWPILYVSQKTWYLISVYLIIECLAFISLVKRRGLKWVQNIQSWFPLFDFYLEEIIPPDLVPQDHFFLITRHSDLFIDLAKPSYAAHHIVFSYYVSPVSSDLWQFLNHFLFMILTSKVLDKDPEMSPIVAFSVVCLKFRLGVQFFWKGNDRRKCPSHHITSGLHVIHTTALLMLIFITWLR